MLLLGCSSAPPGDEQTGNQESFISGVVIRNELAYPVTDVMIEILATGGFAGCGNILPRSECSNAFEQVDYRADSVVIRWAEHGEPHQTDPFTVQLPAGAQPGDTFRLEVIVFAPGQAGARLVDAVP